ncbi:hypothetical protein [Streptomyces sp. NK08204]|uniref:hypothetical protein n=1 Tax=Streptomyces sp. NK08204 TaxID=2873260 RepID=UPI001CEC540F|nr:hypothetical protein [Streptomyces sp. NK08204]
MNNCLDDVLGMEPMVPEGIRAAVPARPRYRAEEPLAVPFRFGNPRPDRCGGVRA